MYVLCVHASTEAHKQISYAIDASTNNITWICLLSLVEYLMSLTGITTTIYTRPTSDTNHQCKISMTPNNKLGIVWKSYNGAKHYCWS